MLPALRKGRDWQENARAPRMLCNGLRKRVAPGTVSISLRCSVQRLTARAETRAPSERTRRTQLLSNPEENAADIKHANRWQDGERREKRQLTKVHVNGRANRRGKKMSGIRHMPKWALMGRQMERKGGRVCRLLCVH